MDFGNILFVGEVFDYPLTGGESLYGLLPTLNDKFSLNLIESDYVNQKAVRNITDGRIELFAINSSGDKIYQFINVFNIGVETVEHVPIEKLPVLAIMKRPVNFQEELEFLSTVPLNKPIYFNIINTKPVIYLQRLLNQYDYGQWSITGTSYSVSNFILRFYGKGSDVPLEYGQYDENVIVAIVDLKCENQYITYCLRTKIYHVYSNGYRSGD